MNVKRLKALRRRPFKRDPTQKKKKRGGGVYPVTNGKFFRVGEDKCVGGELWPKGFLSVTTAAAHPPPGVKF